MLAVITLGLAIGMPGHPPVAPAHPWRGPKQGHQPIVKGPAPEFPDAQGTPGHQPIVRIDGLDYPLSLLPIQVWFSGKKIQVRLSKAPLEDHVNRIEMSSPDRSVSFDPPTFKLSKESPQRDVVVSFASNGATNLSAKAFDDDGKNPLTAHVPVVLGEPFAGRRR